VDALRGGPALVLAGPSERRQVEALPSVRSLLLASDARGDGLLKLEAR